MQKITKLLEPISKVFDAILHPVETFKMLTALMLIYLPAVCLIIFIFYIVTGSKKILRVLTFTILFFILLKFAIVFEMIWLLIVLIVAVLIIRFLGVIM